MNFEDTNQKFGWINEESGEKMAKKNKKFGFWDKLSMLLALSQLLFSFYYFVRNWKKTKED
ncbi:hypothetical protein WZ78_09820 [Leuconostoc mesenteroides subsp. dextranicum]|uniref:Uncharacterized protein n=1 Tax=Leuconostoc falkenbergense TaxID=2766470 RepID=A0ABT7S3M4_9LACO|nr:MULTISPECIES: hypothetical protein [Lactobacillales]MDN5580735.1 hypothetical protein [Lactococcus raffinolactis]MDN6071336.1 hypothetical protein [Lactococcus plantarum]ORI85165.1 hypothetical protein BMS96_08680 [Leuconostoc lactis]RDG17019.1 hypothetical protein DQM11_09700 [Leuconostoc pseudomesenteroides]KMY77292.1 hypothetical protein WZ79_08230 [Leuconostoc mesenteroides subsp. mesenteroides]